MSSPRRVIGFVPGTGKMGTRLAKIFGSLGHTIILGSRDAKKAEEAAKKLTSEIGNNAKISGMDNSATAKSSEIVFWGPHGPLQERHSMLKILAKELENKIIVDITNIMYLYDESKWGQICATEQNRDVLGVKARWVAAFKSNFFNTLETLDTDGQRRQTQVCSDDEEALKIVMQMIDETIFKPINCGSLKNCRIVELMGPPFIRTVDVLNNQGHSDGGWIYKS